MLSPSLEDYLEELYRFSLTYNNVRVTDISKKLKVSLPSVTKALHKLKAGEYIMYQRYGLIKLTEKGKQMGSFLVTRNNLIQKFIALICPDCDSAAEAEAIEHYLSKAAINSFQNMLSFMQNNPEVYQRYLKYIRSQSGLKTLEKNEQSESP